MKSSLAIGGLVLVILLAGLLARGWALGAAEYTPDEELSTGLPLLGYGDLFHNIAGRPPLAFLLQKMVVDVSGSVAPATLRVPSVIAGMLGMLALFALAWRVSGPLAGVVAVALLAFSAFHVELSRDARYYPLLFLCCTIAVAGYLSFFVRGRPRGLAIFAVGMAGGCLTHYSAFLLAGASGLMAPFLLCRVVWRKRFIAHPRWTGGAFLAAAVLGVVGGMLLLPFLEVPLGHVAWPRADRTLTPLFDISPHFLFSQFTQALGVSGVPAWLTMALIALGFASMLWRERAVALVLLGVLILPFAILYLFPFGHWWTPKYFVYMLVPLYLFLANGAEFLARETARFKGGNSSAVHATLAGAIVLFVAVPNVSAILELYRHPLNPHTEMGADLTAWTIPGDTVYTSWPQRQRVLRHYFPAEQREVAMAFLSTQVPFPYSLAEIPGRWYVATGKVEVYPPFAAMMMSERFSRVPYHEFFLATGPNPQRVDFGVTYPGRPNVEGGLTLAPGEQAPVDILIPRAGQRVVYVELSDPPGRGGLKVSLGNIALQVDTVENGYVRVGEMDLVRGKQRFLLENLSGDRPVTLKALELVPSLGEDEITLPAWDFYAMDGGESLATVWPEQVDGIVLLRDFRRGQTAYYRFEVLESTPVVVRLFALQDPPGANVYQIALLGTGLPPVRLSFDGEDGKVDHRDSTPLNLGKGVHTLAVSYVGMGPEEIRKLTDNYRIMTKERLQTPGLEKIQLFNMSGS